MAERRFRFIVLSLFFFFLFVGIIYSQITSRMPAIKEISGVDESGLGLALSSLGAGSLFGFATIPVLIKKLSSRTMLRGGAFGVLVLFLLTPFVYDLVSLCLLFALLGLSFAYFEIAINNQIINLELLSGGHYMLRMHAGWNIGALAGSISGSIFAWYVPGLATNFLSLGILFIIPVLLAARFLLEDVAPEGMEEKKGFSKIPLAVIFCGLFAMCAYTVEGSIAEWGGLVMVQEKQSSESLAALVYGSYSLVTAITRLCSDKIRNTIGDFRIILFGGILAFIGMSLVIFTHSPYLTLTGYGMCGIGLAPLVPIILSRVGHRDDIHPSAATTIVSLFGYGGILVIPPSLGFLAQQFGLINALFLPLALVTTVIFASFVIRRMRA